MSITPLEGNHALAIFADPEENLLHGYELTPKGSRLLWSMPAGEAEPMDLYYSPEDKSFIMSDSCLNLYQGYPDGRLEKLPRNDLLLYNVTFHGSRLLGISNLDGEYYYTDNMYEGHYSKVDFANYDHQLDDFLPTNYFIPRDDNNVKYYVDSQHNITPVTSAEYDGFLLLYAWAVYLSGAYLLLLLLYFLWRNITFDGFVKAIDKTFPYIAVFVIIGFFCYSSIQESISDAGSTAILDAQQMAQQPEADRSVEHTGRYIQTVLEHLYDLSGDERYRLDVLLHCKPDKVYNDDELYLAEGFKDISGYIYDYSRTESSLSNGRTMYLLYFDHQGLPHIFYDSSHWMAPGTLFMPDTIPTIDKPMLLLDAYENDNFFCYYCLPFYNDDGKKIGMLINITQKELFMYKHASFWLSMLFTVLMAGTLFQYLRSELVSFAAARKKYLSLHKQPLENEFIIWRRQFNWLYKIIVTADSILMVLIVKDILEATANDDNALLYAIPFVIQPSMVVASLVLQNLLPGSLRQRTVMLWTSLFTAITVIGLYFAVEQNSYWGFIGGKCLFYLLTCIYGNYSRWKATLYDDEDSLASANTGFTSISGSMAATIICGYLAHYVGSSSIYLSLLLPIGALMLLIYKTAPLQLSANYRRLPINRHEVQQILRRLLVPRTLWLVFFLALPFLFAKVYTTFIFPLIASSFGYNKAIINNISVLAITLLYLNKNTLLKVQKYFDYRYLAIGSLMMIGVISIGFLLTESFIWAVLVLLLAGIPFRIAYLSLNVLWYRNAKESGVNMAANDIFRIATERLIAMLPVPLYTLLFGLGTTAPYILLFCLLCGGSGLYGFLTREKPEDT